MGKRNFDLTRLFLRQNNSNADRQKLSNRIGEVQARAYIREISSRLGLVLELLKGE